MCIEFDIIVGGKYALGFLPGKGRGRNGREDARNKEIDFFFFCSIEVLIEMLKIMEKEIGKAQRREIDWGIRLRVIIYYEIFMQIKMIGLSCNLVGKS